MPNEVRVEEDTDKSEDAEYVVCARATDPLYFSDNLVVPCCRCGKDVQFRPHSPKSPPRVCMECILPDLMREADADDLCIVMTPKTEADLLDYFKRKKAH